jgi:glucose/arabinose dehydrogenase
MGVGTHKLELSSIVDGVESRLSQPLLVTFSSSALTASVPALAADGRSRGVSGLVCTTATAGAVCYDVETIADGLDQVTALSATPNGELLFVEGGSRLRVYSAGVLIPEAALTPRDAGSRLTGLAVDSQFSESRAVFVSWTEPAGDGGQRMNVSRYRLLANSLGEGATIVGGFPMEGNSLAPLTVDRQGLLYVALPAEAVAMRDGAPPSLFGGAVLRVDRRGLTPAANASHSPVISYGYSQPAYLAVEPVSGRLWLGGKNTERPVSSAEMSQRGNASWPVSPLPATLPESSGPGLAETTLAFAKTGDPGIALITIDDRLYVTTPTVDGRLVSATELSWKSGLPSAVTADAEGSWYVAVVTEQGTSAIIRLRPRR